MKKLARFRADPSRVRVAIRRSGETWTVSVSERGAEEGDPVHRATARSPSVATLRALGSALACGMQGIDLGMDWAYDHPMGMESPRGVAVGG